MYACNECHNTFSEPLQKGEWQGEKEHGGTVFYDVCPCCGDEDIEKMSVCPLCSEDFKKPDGFGDFTGDYCPECQSAICIAMDGAVSVIEKVTDIGKRQDIIKAIAAWCERE